VQGSKGQEEGRDIKKGTYPQTLCLGNFNDVEYAGPIEMISLWQNLEDFFHQ
jgi:hypothetical protein